MLCRLLQSLVGVCLLLIVFLIGCAAANLTVNITPSWPVGLYHSKGIEGGMDNYKNKLVLVCPDPDNRAIQKAVEHNILPIGTGCEPWEHAPLMKELVGVPGDQVSITDQGVLINGQLLVNSKIKFKVFEFDYHPGYSHTLQENEYWVMSDYSPNSLDSRYFGPVTRNMVAGHSEPFLIVKKIK